ncbi:MAG: hypothetical protein ABFD18_06215 [Syntrophomonas sp.]
MLDPFKEIANVLDKRMAGQVSMGTMGTQCVLGTMTATGVLLDDFKHEIKDPLYADWTLKLNIPLGSRIVSAAAPVTAQGADIPNVTTSTLTRMDFSNQDAEYGAGGANDIQRVNVELKSRLKAGDRILAIPINGGQECVIICKVVS